MARFEARILLVDDEAHMRRTVRRMLHTLGYRNIDENDGKTVLSRLRLGRYDLIICDLRMEPHTGLEVLASVRSDPILKDVPFLMLTGETAVWAVTEAMNAGATDYIAKPFSLRTLAAKLERALPSE